MVSPLLMDAAFFWHRFIGMVAYVVRDWQLRRAIAHGWIATSWWEVDAR